MKHNHIDIAREIPTPGLDTSWGTLFGYSSSMERVEALCKARFPEKQQKETRKASFLFSCLPKRTSAELSEAERSERKLHRYVKKNCRKRHRVMPKIAFRGKHSPKRVSSAPTSEYIPTFGLKHFFAENRDSDEEDSHSCASTDSSWTINEEDQEEHEFEDIEDFRRHIEQYLEYN